MKRQRHRSDVGVVLLVALAVGLLGASIASATSSSSVVPGSYKGPVESFGPDHQPIVGPGYAKVSRAAGKFSISLDLAGAADCGTEDLYTNELKVTVKATGKTFSGTGTVAEPVGPTLRYSVRGKFTKPTLIEGIFKATGKYDLGAGGEVECPTEDKFKLYKGKP